MLNPLLQIDAQVTHFIAFLIPHNLFMDYFFGFFSLKGNSVIVWGIVALLLIFFEEKFDKKFVWYLGGSFLVASFINNEILKIIFARPRPDFHLASFIGCPSNFSFPSGHAAGAFSAAVILAHFDPKRKWFYYALAALVGLSRIYLGCHYLLDVLGGAVVGSAISYFFIRIHMYYQTKKARHSGK